jgi:hypothetical protein
MSVLTHQPVGATAGPRPEKIHGAYGRVAEIISQLGSPKDVAERRREDRCPFPYLVHLTPVDQALRPVGETVAVVGKHLSQRGLGFYHAHLLPHRRMIVSLEAGEGCWLSFLIDVKWCRFTRQGWYESGGRFLQPVDPPIELTQ